MVSVKLTLLESSPWERYRGTIQFLLLSIAGSWGLGSYFDRIYQMDEFSNGQWNHRYLFGAVLVLCGLDWRFPLAVKFEDFVPQTRQKLVEGVLIGPLLEEGCCRLMLPLVFHRLFVGATLVDPSSSMKWWSNMAFVAAHLIPHSRPTRWIHRISILGHLWISFEMGKLYFRMNPVTGLLLHIWYNAMAYLILYAWLCWTNHPFLSPPPCQCHKEVCTTVERPWVPSDVLDDEIVRNGRTKPRSLSF